jgi:ParB-like chromosome segregation protein Spo0J
MLQGVSFDPVLVVIGLDGLFAVIDGHHRAAASALCAFDFIPAIVNPKKGESP